MTPLDKSARYYFFDKRGERVMSIISFYECKDIVNLFIYPHVISESRSVFVENMIDVNPLIEDISRSTPARGYMFEYII